MAADTRVQVLRINDRVSTSTTDGSKSGGYTMKEAFDHMEIMGWRSAVGRYESGKKVYLGITGSKI